MRKPKNIADYEPAAVIAAHFEDLANDIRQQTPGTLMKFAVQLWWWNPEWEDAPKAKAPLASKASAEGEEP